MDPITPSAPQQSSSEPAVVPQATGVLNNNTPQEVPLSNESVASLDSIGAVSPPNGENAAPDVLSSPAVSTSFMAVDTPQAPVESDPLASPTVASNPSADTPMPESTAPVSDTPASPQPDLSMPMPAMPAQPQASGKKLSKPMMAAVAGGIVVLLAAIAFLVFK